MKSEIELYHEIKSKVTFVTFLYQQLQLQRQEKKTGRKLAIPIIDGISMYLFKQVHSLATKRAVFNIFQPPCTYKTLKDILGLFIADEELSFVIQNLTGNASTNG